MEWQDYTVWAIGALAALTVVRWLWCLMRGRGRKGCAACGDTSCPLRDLKRKKG